MIRFTDAKFETLNDTDAGTLVVYRHSSWLRCLVIAYPDEEGKDLLPLEAQSAGVTAFSPLVVKDNADFIVLGKAEIYVEPADLKFPDPRSSAPSIGQVALHPKGAAIIGEQSKVGWLISTGTRVTPVPPEDPRRVFSPRWKLGTIRPDGVFAEVLSFPATQSATATPR